MYILIDLEKMLLLHKHDDLDVICNLAWIECQNVSYCIFPLDDATGFRNFTFMELRLLYKNVTGRESPNKWPRLNLIQILFDLCIRLPECDVVGFEVELQAEYVQEFSPLKWRYIKGARRPGEGKELFEFTSKLVSPSEEQEARALRGELPALKRAQHAPKLRTSEKTNKAERTPTSKVKHNTTQTSAKGTAKEKIFSLANTYWENENKPSDLNSIKLLKKKVSEELKAMGLHPTTISCQLSKWQKTL